MGAAITWAAVVRFAYVRRHFGGSARNYVFAWMGLSALTIATLTLMAIVEAS